MTVAYELDSRLVIGIASSALFDLTDSDAFFQGHTEVEYREYQQARQDETLEPGAAFPFIKRLLALNDLRPDDPVVEVIVLSKNDPLTGLRVMRSIAKHDLPITRAVFGQGRAPHKYIEAFSMSLFLSGNRADVDEAVKAGSPAGHVLPSSAQYDDSDPTLRIAFDFDGVLGDDKSERFYKEGGLDSYQDHEAKHRDVALAPGPLKPLLADLNVIQGLESDRRALEPDYQPRLRISLVTARNAPAHERAVHSLRSWGVNVNEAFFLGGIEKAKVLGVMQPHIFFDDQTVHLDGVVADVAGVHVPYGIANEVEGNHSEQGDEVADRVKE